MTTIRLLFLLLALQASTFALGQSSNPVIALFPEGTVLHANIPYNNDTLEKHLFDIYLPSNAKRHVPLVVFIHGGWSTTNTLTSII